MFFKHVAFSFWFKNCSSFCGFKLFSFSLKLLCDFLELLASTSSNHRNTSKVGSILNVFILFFAYYLTLIDFFLVLVLDMVVLMVVVVIFFL